MKELEEFDAIDKEIYRGSDTPLDMTDELFEKLVEELEELIEAKFWGDRCFILRAEVCVSFMCRLSSYYYNTFLTYDRVSAWKQKTLDYFDQETGKQGDADEVKEWRSNIVRNFDRLFEYAHD